MQHHRLRITTDHPTTIHELIAIAMLSSTSSSSSSSSDSNNAFLPPPYRKPSPLNEKYSPPPTPSPLQARNPFERPHPRLNIPHTRPQHASSYPRRSRTKTLGRLAILVIIIVCAGSAVNSWGCSTPSCISRDALLDKARKIGHDGGAYVGGGAVLGKFHWAGDHHANGEAGGNGNGQGRLSEKEREKLMMNDSAGQAGMGEHERDQKAEQWFVETNEGQGVDGDPEIIVAEERHENQATPLTTEAQDGDAAKEVLFAEQSDMAVQLEIASAPESTQETPASADLQSMDDAQDAQDEAFAKSLLVETKVSEPDAKPEPEPEPEPEHTHVGDADPGFKEAMMEGHTLGSMAMDF
ncbi:hypothetical protein T440DRAFT_313649 [Plenodomus tracheiphilus IPT5]|uniref:Uncharacterized protein n=1 Tax=Plenodomus tracheiphilus IPT5 TaxID=1408161 RepID=A0A6A7BGY3_9PLEO|nr:hypothetical protein T440DRAFT_313649 [Plenodomus tracheiphilus IPT5]